MGAYKMNYLRLSRYEWPRQLVRLFQNSGWTVAITTLALTIATVAHFAGSAGYVQVFANMEPFNPNPTKVNNASIAVLRVFYYPPSGVPEGDLSALYDWSLAQVQFKSLQADAYGSPPPNRYTDSIAPAQPSVQSGAMLTFTPKIAGYWEVSVNCSVVVLDTKTGETWTDEPGTGGAGPQDLTSAIVTFSPNPVVTGADKKNLGAIFAPVTATVQPADLTSKISLNTFIDSGTGSAGVENSKPNAATGTIPFDLYGINGTSKTMPQGDIELDAKDGSTVLGTVEVTVVIPAAIGTPHPTFNGAVTPVNVDLSATSVPSDSSVPAGEVLLGTLVETTQSIPVIDQFGKSLNSVYNG